MKLISTISNACILSLLLSSCTFYTQVQVVDPINIDPQTVKQIKKLSILNRTGIKKGQGGNHIFEGILTGELPGADKEGAKASVAGLSECLSKSLNYTSNTIIPVTFYGSNDRNVPTALPWGLVDSVCKANNTDALIALEYFDSNSGVSLGLTNPNVPVGYGTNTNNVSIKTYWRYYDTQTKNIIDFYELKTISNNGRYKSPYLAQNVMDKYNTTKGASFWAGIEYGFRISEQLVNEARLCYSSGNKAMRIAGRYARLGNWETAANIWDEQMSSPKRRVVARALYNKAVYLEKNGNLEGALDLATRSAAIRYRSTTVFLVNRLKQQISDRQRLLSAMQ